MSTLKTHGTVAGQPIPFKLIYDWLDQGLPHMDYVKQFDEALAAAKAQIDPRAARAIISKLDPELYIVAEQALQSSLLYDAMKLKGDRDFVFAALVMQRMFGLSPNNLAHTTKIKLPYMLAQSLFEAQQHVWVLDEGTMDSLMGTAVPKALVADRLPYLPWRTMLIVLPPGTTITVDVGINKDRDATADDMEFSTEGMYRPKEFAEERTLRISSMLIYEDIPGVKWRYMGFQDSGKVKNLGYNEGWFDISYGNAVDLLPFYASNGDGAIWQMLINLFMVLEHGDYLVGQPVQVPTLPPKRGKKQRMQDRKSALNYTVVNLGRRAFDERDAAKTSDRSDPSGRASPYLHDVDGFFKGVWVREPEQRSVRGERVNEHGNTVYRVSSWIPPYTRGDPTKPRPEQPRRKESRVTRRRRRKS